MEAKFKKKDLVRVSSGMYAGRQGEITEIHPSKTAGEAPDYVIQLRKAGKEAEDKKVTLAEAFLSLKS